MTPVKYECDSRNLTGTFARSKILLTEKLANGALVTPTPDQQQGKSEGFDCCNRPSNLRLDSNRQFFSLCDLEIWWMTSKNNRELLLYYIKLCDENPLAISNWSYSPEKLNLGWNWQYFVPCDLDIWWMTLENNRATLLYYIKLYASFQIHRLSQTWVTVRKPSIRVKIGDFYPRPVLAFGYCHRLRLCVCPCVYVCVCINHLIVRTITRQPFTLESPNLDERRKTPWLRCL